MRTERNRRLPLGHRWLGVGAEPDLAEVLADPMVHLVMERDGVSPCALRRVVVAARVRLRIRLCTELAA
jgi:hypothetical protein